MQLLGVPSPIIDAALSVLADGKARTADEILDEARTRKLLDAGVTRKHVYTSLSQYIERAMGSGRRPQITEDAQDRFRINRAPDDWPDIDTTGLVPLDAEPALSAETSHAVAGLRAAAKGIDPTAFEIAVCKLFDRAGFAATHVGGKGAPDGYADALLGPLRYRVLIECKLASAETIAHSDAAVEASKFLETYRGDACVLVAPNLEPRSSFVSELHAHGVSAWTVEDLLSLVTRGINAVDARHLFAVSGLVADELEDFNWARAHGAPKRLRVVASSILSHATAMQRMTYGLGYDSDAPHFTMDVALATIDEQLRAAGSECGCAPEEVRAVFEWLTSPLVRRAVWADDTRTSIVVI